MGKFDDRFEPVSKFEGRFEPVDAPSQAESAVRGTVQGGTFNFADEAVATLGAGAVAGAQGIAQGLDALGIKDLPEGADLRSFGEIRGQILEEERGRFSAAQEANPGTFLAGEIAGGVASPVPIGKVGALAKGATLGARALSGAKAGVAAGAVAGLGASEADLAEGELGQAALDTAVGATGGAVLGSALPAAGVAFSKARASAVGELAENSAKLTRDVLKSVGTGVENKLSPFLTQAGRKAEAGIQAAKAAGMQGISDLRTIGDVKAVARLGNWAIDNGLISAEKQRLDADSIAAATEALKESSGQLIGQVRKAAQEAGFGSSADVLVRQVDRLSMKLKRLSDLPEVARVLSVGERVKAAIRSNTDDAGRVSAEFLDDLKRAIDDDLFAAPGQTTNKQASLSDAAAQMRLNIRNLFRDEEEKVVSQLGKGVLDEFKQAKEAFGNTSDLLFLAGRQEARDASNVMIGLRDTIILSGGQPGAQGVPGRTLAFLGKQVGDIAGNAGFATGLRSRAADSVEASARALGPPARKAVAISREAASLLSQAQRTGGPRGLAVAAAQLISADPSQQDAILQDVRRRQANLQAANSEALGLQPVAPR